MLGVEAAAAVAVAVAVAAAAAVPRPSRPAGRQQRGSKAPEHLF